MDPLADARTSYEALQAAYVEMVNTGSGDPAMLDGLASADVADSVVETAATVADNGIALPDGVTNTRFEAIGVATDTEIEVGVCELAITLEVDGDVIDPDDVSASYIEATLARESPDEPFVVVEQWVSPELEEPWCE